MHDTRPSPIERSMQAWLQAMHGFVGRPSRALATSAASARNGRAIDTRSTADPASSACARSTPSMRLPAITATASPTAALTPSATDHQAPGGTAPCTVGTADSCQPMPTLIASAPAPAIARAKACASAAVVEPGIRSAPVRRKMSGNDGPTAARIARVSSTPKRMRRSGSPPQSSSRWLVSGERNWSTR